MDFSAAMINKAKEKIKAEDVKLFVGDMSNFKDVSIIKKFKILKNYAKTSS